MSNYGLRGTVRKVTVDEFERRRCEGPDAEELLRLAESGRHYEVAYEDEGAAKADHTYLMNLRTRRGLTASVVVSKSGLRLFVGPRGEGA